MQDGSYRLITSAGSPNFGMFDKPLMDINIDELRPYGRERYSKISRALVKHFRIKRWQYVGITNREIAFGSAIVSTGYLGNVFVYLFDRTQGELFELSFIRPFATGIKFEGSPYKGSVSFDSAGCTLEFVTMPDRITLKLRTNKGHADILIKRECEPLSVVIRNSPVGFNYTDKEAGLITEGTIYLAGREYELKGNESFAVSDYTIGHLLRETFWNWASGGGFLKDGKRVGFNLSLGINESGITENVFWVENKMIRYGNVNFVYNDIDLMKDWHIFSTDGRIDIKFTPEGIRKADINAIIVRSRFFQPFGRFNGYINDSQKNFIFDEVFGFVEEHYAKW